MALTVAQLMDALPESEDREIEELAVADRVADPRSLASMWPVPVGRFHRLRLLGTLQAKIGAAYLFHWVRGWFRNAEENKRLLAETHWKTALRVLDSMTYLRGAVMKLGQMLATLPNVAPKEFIEALDCLYFQAPPMHWSLLRELVHNELGDDPENIFASFDKQAFAAASLGQVHRARLKTGEDVVVKIQYPGIARTIREDMRNLALFMLPNRLNRDWDCLKDQVDDLCLRMEYETDYEREASTQEAVRKLFSEDDGIVVPRVFREYSTSRVLTMERLDGVHLDEFMATNPSDDVRNEFARKLLRSGYRMSYTGRLMYADLHPGNFLFMPDGRLGLLDFGMVVPIEGEFWELMRRMDRGFSTGVQADRINGIKEWSWITDDRQDAEPLRLLDQFTDWTWRSRSTIGEYDFCDEAEFRRGIDLFLALLRTRFARGRSQTLCISRLNFGLASFLYRLKAKVAVLPIAEQEVRATGWDRSEYALRCDA